MAFIVPALNEQDDLEATVHDIATACETRSVPFRVYVFDDGSSDATPAVADRLAASDSRVRVVHNARTMGLGYNYFHGIELADEEYAMMVPGDHEIPGAAVGILLDHAGEADLVIPNLTGDEARPLGRRILSKTFVRLLNLLFGLRITYYNGPCLLRRRLVLDVPLRTEGFAYMAAILVSLLKAGHSYLEVTAPMQYRRTGGSKALRPRNILSVLWTLVRLRLAIDSRG